MVTKHDADPKGRVSTKCGAVFPRDKRVPRLGGGLRDNVSARMTAALGLKHSTASPGALFGAGLFPTAVVYLIWIYGLPGAEDLGAVPDGKTDLRSGGWAPVTSAS